MTIWKFPIMITGYQVVMLQKGANIIKAGLDPNDVPCLWAIVDESKERTEQVNIYVHGTGFQIGRGEKYIGSFNQNHTFVWHVFTE